MANEKEKGKKTIGQFRRNQLIFIWSLLALPILSWLVWYLYTHIFNFIIAFQDPGTGDFSLINFETMWRSIFYPTNKFNSLQKGFSNTLSYFIVNNAVIFPLQILLSYFIYKRIFGFKFYRVVFYFPAIISGVAMTQVFKAFIDPNGPLSELLVSWGLGKLPDLLHNQDTVNQTLWVYVIYTGLAGRMLITCGAMSRIPTEILESGRLDGVGAWGEFIHIIIPMISPTLSTYLIMALSGILGSTGPVLLLAKDVETLGTTTVNYWMFEKVWAGGNFGQGQYNLVSATSLTFAFMMMPIVLIGRKIIEKYCSVDF